jgi:CelD/BcsL family acetyltransferase involved in cellulose biosynthesis
MSPQILTVEEHVADSATLSAPVHRGGVELIERWAEPWRELCDDAVDDQPFYRPEWIAAHIRAFTPHAKVLLITITIEGRLHLVLPLLEERALLCGVPVRKLRTPVNGHSCRLDAVRRRGLEEGFAIQSLWRCLKSLPGWDVLEFEGVPAEGTLSALARAAGAEGFQTGQVSMSPNPYVPILAGLSSLSELPINKKLRSQLRGIHRELANQGELRLRRIESADQGALQRFYELEAAGWKGAERTAIASSPQCLQFYNEIARSAEKLGHLCLYQLEFNGQLVAAHFGLLYKGRYFSPKVAYDESFRQWAPGHLIVEEILKECAARRVREYDITGQNDDWKRKWTDQARGQGTQFIFAPRTSGRVAHLARFRVRPWLKSAVDRWLRPPIHR